VTASPSHHMGLHFEWSRLVTGRATIETHQKRCGMSASGQKRT